jgi:tungstate transport system substrate-binding protein
LGAVNTPDYSGLLDELVAQFGAHSGMQVTVYSGEDVYQHARAGEVDLILSHYGHKDVEAFMTDGLGQWPRTVFANQIAVVGPPADPAGVRGLTDATEAFRRIAASGSTWVVNNLPGLGYLEAILWEGAGRPSKGEWYVDTDLAQGQAVQMAGRRGAYTVWGIFPFLRFLEQQRADLEPLVLADSLLQRIMVTILPDPRHFPTANLEGAAALQQFLLTPATQAHIREFRYPGRSEQLWWPAGRHNHPSVLPDAGAGEA